MENLDQTLVNSLKKTLNFDCVKQITTRDGIEELKKYRVNEQVIIDRVSDPAVFEGNCIWRNRRDWLEIYFPTGYGEKVYIHSGSISDICLLGDMAFSFFLH